jgi:hypothetical protein
MLDVYDNTTTITMIKAPQPCDAPGRIGASSIGPSDWVLAADSVGE